MAGIDQIGADVVVRQAMGQFGGVAAEAVGKLGVMASGVADQATRAAQDYAQDLGAKASGTVEELGLHASDAAEKLQAVATDAAGQIVVMPVRFEFGWLAFAAAEHVQAAASSVHDVAARLVGLASSAAVTCHESLSAGARPILEGDFARVPNELMGALGTCAGAVASSVELLVKYGP